MRRRFLAALLLGATVAGTAAAGPARRPTLTLVQRAPLEVRGTRFRPRERVHLRAVAPTGDAAAAVRSTRRGRFLARFPTFAPAGCLRLVITAVGTSGDRATLVVPPSPGPAEDIPCPA